MLTTFALYRIPVIAVLLAAALFLRRRDVAPALALRLLTLPLLGLLATSAGDMVMARGKLIGGCAFFGFAHLCFFCFLARRGDFAWEAAGILTLLLVPFLAVLIFPAMERREKIAVAAYAFCSVVSLSAAIGCRRAPAGRLYLGGIAALVVSDLLLSLRLAKIMNIEWPIAVFYAISPLLLTAALLRSIPSFLFAPGETERIGGAGDALCRQHRNALVMQYAGFAMPFLFLGAMMLYNGSYCWYDDYISASGLIFLKGHRPNHLSAWLLTSGLTGSGMLCAWYFEECFRHGGAPFWQRCVILFSGVLGGIGLVGIGIAPFDQHPDLHNACTLCTVPFGIAIFFSSLTPGDRFGTRTEKTIWLIFVLFTLAVIGALTWLTGHKPVGLPRSPTGPVVQKMVVLAFYIYMLGQVVAYCRNTAPLQIRNGDARVSP